MNARCSEPGGLESPEPGSPGSPERGALESSPEPSRLGSPEPGRLGPHEPGRLESHGASGGSDFADPPVPSSPARLPIRRIDLVDNPGADLTPALDCARRHGILAYPTETVYGLGSLVDPEGVRALAKAKRRSSQHPFLVLARSPSELGMLHWNRVAETLAHRFWPGPLTLVLADPTRSFPSGIRSESGDVAVRVSPDPVVRRLLDALGRPVTSTSANPPGMSPARSAGRAQDALVSLGVRDYCVIDGGERGAEPPSTVVSCLDGRPAVLREGAVGSLEIQRVIGG